MDWRLSRAAKPIRDERRAAANALAAAPDEWQAWWTERGERELRCILMTAWDPIGVGDVPEAWDEYDSYIGGVAQRLRTSADDDERTRRVADYLHHIERDFMEMTPTATRQREYLASTLIAWHEWSFRRGGRPPTDAP